ncbi:hypothetical protein Pcinc_026286 [Petrolisthes cinctipes]|uniref:C2H2-type domain-containing protein n=1 Tax=Petrolisthes cinctipes TaxID=88211 RepID=A0AAE1F6S5_PETCI|nr:hypothetical protein Pcinc_026286 [Petrolisthes cinctipes]
MYPTTTRTVVAKSAGTQTDGSRMQINQEKQRYDGRLAAKYFQFVQLNYGKMRRVSQDGKINRPTPSVVGFLEDYAEFMFDTSEGRENHSPSYLESTVDGSLIKGARRSHTSRVSTQDLDFFIDTAVKSGTKEQDPLIALEELGLKTEVHKYKCSKCVFESRSRSDVEDHMILAGSEHSEAVVEVLLGNEARGKTCPLCSTKLQESQLFKHIRCCHKSNFPLRCGYCVFLGQDYNQLRHHIKKKHKTSNYQIIDVRHILAQIENPGMTEGGTAQDEFTGSPNKYQEFVCPVCDETLKTLSNLKKHIMKHSRKKQKCVLCPFTTSHPRQIRRHYERKHPTQTPQWETKLVEKNTNGAIVEDVTPVLKLITAKYGLRQPNKMKGWIRQYRCPHCDYTCNFNSSYNRHMRIHKGIKPFKCGHCDFHAREAYVVRKHSTKAHKGTPIVIESGKTFKAPYRYSYRKLKADQPSIEGSEFRIPTLADSWTLSEDAGNAAITKGSVLTEIPVLLETDIYKRKSIVSVQSTTWPTVSEPVYSGVRSDSQVQNTCNENSKLSTISMQENIYKEETVVEIEKGIPNYPQQTDNIIHTLLETEANDKKSVEKSQTLSVIGARGYGEKNLQKSQAKTEVSLENNLHTHIAFLVDSREQQRSNTVSVSPGFITRDLQGLDYSNNDYFSSETVRNMMKRKNDGQATCIVCEVTTTYRAFYKHAKKHFNMKPFKCGYCSYRSIEKSKIRVHNTFRHSNKPCIIQKLSPENAALQHAQVPTERCSAYKSILTSQASFITENEEGVAAEKNESDAECSKTSLLSVADTISSEPYQKVSKTSETIDEGQMTTSDKATLSENSNNNLICSSDKPSKDPTHRSQMYKCSVCSKLMKKHTPSVRRHLYSHFKYKPYKCGYCSFTGSGPTEVRAHHVTHGSTVPPKVEHEITQMPAELASLVKNIFSHRRGKSTQSKRKQASQRSSPRATESDCAYRRPEVTATHSSKRDVCMTWQKTSQNLLVAAHQQESKKAPGDDLTLTLQTKERREIASENECAVKALESDDITSGSLPSHINFKMPTESHSDVDSDPVCVVYLLDGRLYDDYSLQLHHTINSTMTPSYDLATPLLQHLYDHPKIQLYYTLHLDSTFAARTFATWDQATTNLYSTGNNLRLHNLRHV